MKNFQFLLRDVYLLKLYSDKGCDIDCFAMKITDTINNYDDYDKFNFLGNKQPQYFSTITFCIYGDDVIKKIQNLEDELFTLYYTNAVDFNEGTIDDRKFTCSNISYVKCHGTKISNLDIEKSEFCSDIRATFTVNFLWYENLYDPNYNGHSYDEKEMFNKKDIVSIFNTNKNDSNTKLNYIDKESYLNSIDENCIFEEITNDITEKMNKVFEDTANSLLMSNLMLM